MQILTQALQAPAPELRRMASKHWAEPANLGQNAIGSLLSDQTPRCERKRR